MHYRLLVGQIVLELVNGQVHTQLVMPMDPHRQRVGTEPLYRQKRITSSDARDNSHSSTYTRLVQAQIDGCTSQLLDLGYLIAKLTW